MSAPASMDLSDHEVSKGLPKIAWRVLGIFALLAVISLVLYLAGSIYGERISQVGHTEDDTPFDIVIGNDFFSIPANMIRHEEQRIGGVAAKIDLYIHWPTRGGYRSELAAAFSESDPEKMEIALLSISPRRSLLDMPERFRPVYANAFSEAEVNVLSNGLYVARLSAEYGYINERLYYSRPNSVGKPQFIARCQEAEAEQDRLLLPCETDLFIGNSSELKIRFPASQTRRWQDFSAELAALVGQLNKAN